MAYRFQAISVPAGLGGALFDGAKAQVDFSRQVEAERLRLAREASQREEAKMAMDADLARVRAADLAADNARQERKQQFDQAMDVANLQARQQGLNLEAGRLDLSERGFSLDIAKENRARSENVQQTEQNLRKEALELVKMGARPAGKGDTFAAGETPYMDGKGRVWAVPAENSAQMKNLRDFAKTNIDIINADIASATRARSQMEDDIAKLRKDERYVAAMDNIKTRGAKKVLSDREKAGVEADRKLVAEHEARIAAKEADMAQLADPATLTKNREFYVAGLAQIVGASDMYNQFRGVADAPPQTTGNAASAAAPGASPFSEAPVLQEVASLPSGLKTPDVNRIKPEFRQQFADQWNQLAKAEQDLSNLGEMARIGLEASRAAYRDAELAGGAKQRAAKALLDAATQREVQYAKLLSGTRSRLAEMAAMTSGK